MLVYRTLEVQGGVGGKDGKWKVVTLSMFFFGTLPQVDFMTEVLMRPQLLHPLTSLKVEPFFLLSSRLESWRSV